MDNPIIQAESNYYYHGLTLEIPLPSSLSTLRNVTLLKLVHSDVPNSSPSGGALKAGNRKFPHPVCCVCLEEPDGLWNLEILSALHPPGQSWKPEAGNWKFPPTSEWPGANAHRKLETGNSSPVWLQTPEAAWKLKNRQQVS